MMLTFPNFTQARATLRGLMRTHSMVQKTEKWQGRDVSHKPDMVTHELLMMTVKVPMIHEPRWVGDGFHPFDLDHWREDIKPNLPWADDHFAERVGGEPLNPGETWKTWPWAHSADTFRENQQFNHSYMERLWPRYAGMTHGGLRTKEFYSGDADAHRGIRWSYGDLESLVDLLVKEPRTRQAYIPLFFPEDTGIGDGGRKPCTLGYQFIMRDNQLHCYYPMRSCDLVRHYQDDVYLAVRLMLWVIEQCQKDEATIAPEHRKGMEVWRNVVPGSLTMHMTSLHVFRNDMATLNKDIGE